MSQTSIYLIGSLRNDVIPDIGNLLRSEGYDVFDQWFAAGKIADDSWQEYSNRKGLTYKEALADYSAKHVFAFDKKHLDRCDIAVLVLPAGKSGHIELGYMAGKGKRTYVLFDQTPERYDCMYQFADDVFFDLKDLIVELDINPIEKPEVPRQGGGWLDRVRAGRNRNPLPTQPMWFDDPDVAQAQAAPIGVTAGVLRGDTLTFVNDTWTVVDEATPQPTPDEVMRRVPEIQNRLNDVLVEERTRFREAVQAGTTNNG